MGRRKCISHFWCSTIYWVFRITACRSSGKRTRPHMFDWHFMR